MTGARDIVLPPQAQALKRAFRELVALVGGQEAAAGFTRVSQSQISDYGRPNVAVFAPVDVVADLEAVCHGAPDHPPVTRLLALLAGFSLSPMEGGAACAQGIHHQLAALARAEAAAESALLEAIADGRLTPSERDRALALVDRQLGALMQMRSSLAGCDSS